MTLQRPLRVLVVEDEPDLAFSEAVLLRLEGYEVAVAGDGPAALREAQNFQPDVVLLDIGLPGMDGYRVARALQERTPVKRPLVIACSGFEEEAAGTGAPEAGIDLYLLKPVDMAALQKVLE